MGLQCSSSTGCLNLTSITAFHRPDCLPASNFCSQNLLGSLLSEGPEIIFSQLYTGQIGRGCNRLRNPKTDLDHASCSPARETWQPNKPRKLMVYSVHAKWKGCNNGRSYPPQGYIDTGQRRTDCPRYRCTHGICIKI